MAEEFKHIVAKENRSYRCGDETEHVSANNILHTYKSLLSGNGQRYESFIPCVNTRRWTCNVYC